MSTALLVIGSLVLFLPAYQRLGILHPLTVTLGLWLAISLLIAARPVNLFVPSLRVAVAIVLGLAALALPPLLLHRAGRGRGSRGDGEPAAAPVRVTVRVWHLTAATVAVGAVVVWGALQYRSAVAAVLGQPFTEVDTKLVRWAELYGDLTLSPAVGIAQALAPVLGALGVIGGLCHRWWWYLLVPAALVATMQSPSRTATLTVAVTTIFFFLLLSRSPGLVVRGSRSGRPSRWRTATLFSVVGGLGLGYFGFVAQQLDKADLPAGLTVAGWVPELGVQPLLYQLGGVSAFTAALDESTGDAGPYGEFGRSVYAVVKAVQFLGVHIPTPQPFAGYVDMPIPFNTYTAFGDAYFDFGLAGVLLVFLVTGLLVHLLDTWPRPGHPGSVWAMSVMAAVLTATPIHMRLLDGDILIPALVGAAVVGLVLRTEPAGRGARGTTPADRIPVAAGAGGPAPDGALPAR